MKDSILDEINRILLAENVLVNEPMRNHTTFKIGGPADALVKVTDLNILKELIAFLNSESVDYFILGNGSNILVSDNGYNGVMVTLADSMSSASVEGNRIKAGAGAMLSAVARKAYEQSLTGLEFASGIPGTIGGALIMNAGAYDGEMKMVVENVTILSPDGEIKILSNEEMAFGYRTSAMKGTNNIILSATLLLQVGNKSDIGAKMADFAQRRRDKQPLEYPSAGSTFKRPEGYFAGKLIQDSGLSGYTVGGACISTKHNGFVINTGDATSTDVKQLIEDVQKIVFEKQGVKLEPEVIYV